MARLWIRGFELPITQEEGQQNQGTLVHPGYSRQPQPRSLAVSVAHAPAQGGCGYASINVNNLNTQLRSNTFSTGGAAGFFAESFWIYANRFGTGEDQWFSSVWTDPQTQTLRLTCDQFGQVRLYNITVSNPYPGILVGLIGAIPQRAWVYVLIRYIYQVLGAGGKNQYLNVLIALPDYRTAVNGPAALKQTYASMSDYIFHAVPSLGTAATHAGSRLGEDQSIASTGLEMFYDDWSADDAYDVGPPGNTNRPNGGIGGLYYPGIVLPLLPQSAGTYSAWTVADAGALEGAYPRHTDLVNPGTAFLTSPAGASTRHSFACGTCVSQQVATSADTIGCVLAMAHSLDPTLCNVFLRINGVDQTFLSRQFVFGNSVVLLLRREDLIVLPTDTIEIGVVASQIGVRVLGMGVEVQVVNVDYPSPTDLASTDLNINVAFGRYTGTGTRNVITAGFAPRWICILREFPSQSGVLWWDTRLAASGLDLTPMHPEKVPQVTATGFIVNSSNDVNFTGQHICYVAISDPQARGFASGAIPSHVTTDNGSQNFNQIPPQGVRGQLFVPTFQMARQDDTKNNTAVWYLFATGASNSAVATGGQVGDALQALPSGPPGRFATGLGMLNAMGTDVWGIPFAFWRSDQFNAKILWNTARWTGDGTASRVIPVVLTGQVPGWIVAIGLNGDTGVVWIVGMGPNNAQLISNSGSTGTGILAVGANSFTVGAFSNKAGVEYFAFAIAGGDGTVPTLDAAPLVVTDPGAGYGFPPFCNPASS